MEKRILAILCPVRIVWPMLQAGKQPLQVYTGVCPTAGRPSLLSVMVW